MYRPFFTSLAYGKKLDQQIFARNPRKLKEKLFTEIHALFFVLGRTFGLFFHGEDINMVKGHNVGFVVNLKPLAIHHKLIAFYIHNGYRSIGEHLMHNIRSVPLALQFPLSEGFKPRIVEEDLISFFKLFFFNLLSYHLLILSLYMLA
jgi:hypothetical protein